MNEEAKEEKFVRRFTLDQVTQHILLFIFFIILSVTGLCLTYRETWLAQFMVDMMGGWMMRMYIHRGSGVILIFLGIYHLYYIVADRRVKGKDKLKIMLNLKDVTDIIAYLKHMFGRGEAPKYDRFSWKEKFDYWGALWGMVMMCGTGFVMMYPVWVTKLLPYSYINLSRILHSHEATIAISFIAIWHIYNVHFAPHRTRGVWITGKISEKEMKEHHPEEYDEYIATKEPEPTLESDLEY